MRRRAGGATRPSGSVAVVGMALSPAHHSEALLLPLLGLVHCLGVPVCVHSLGCNCNVIVM